MGLNEIKSQVRSKQRNIKTKLNTTTLQRELTDGSAEQYRLYHQVITELLQAGDMQAIRPKETNGRTPPLPLQAWLMPSSYTTLWDPLALMRLADRIDISGYQRHPEWQTEEEWKHISRLYKFLQLADTRQIVSVEERCLELFGDEKFFSEGGKQLLSRTGVTLTQLKTRALGEPFAFWLRPGTELATVRGILIVENLGFYHTCRMLMPDDIDMVIYGGGKHIEKSFLFYYDIFPASGHLIQYAGDMDPEGYGIFLRLKARYPEADIRLAKEIYQDLCTYDSEARPCKQEKKEQHLEAFLAELRDEYTCGIVCDLWKRDLRLAQEFLTVESWPRVIGARRRAEDE
ncbi:hypothetical protein FHS18_005520 [Paenibacillus phyllosphaerae]|uniref:Wadjet protein JetD C-terminal domain-containing protein n=1 Tax=Paenibacillus phyllosphaerae TaxID=274593 RepID=A0A7W5B319_9BACL|nr:Wadjet anti-phage system protein JetD domain-containing protein [Paenibacillus phyllosphaerae]MBB3113408.1 hypothetical protein [Paenibacillus phyllosphaerae]